MVIRTIKKYQLAYMSRKIFKAMADGTLGCPEKPEDDTKDFTRQEVNSFLVPLEAANQNRPPFQAC
ncbi:hypothetical protein [Candidatus Odyssella thessalonicensis]|uniref:hypothetical protein n=1 Tax=Candidatus Odyssella thessalonicensis TaxID=84647 RepID=UPI000225B741|nr:hypothetical protein [Candidatus Odyssella thessalonicensis]